MVLVILANSPGEMPCVELCMFSPQPFWPFLTMFFVRVRLRINLITSSATTGCGCDFPDAALFPDCNVFGHFSSKKLSFRCASIHFGLIFEVLNESESEPLSSLLEFPVILKHTKYFFAQKYLSEKSVMMFCANVIVGCLTFECVLTRFVCQWQMFVVICCAVRKCCHMRITCVIILGGTWYLACCYDSFVDSKNQWFSFGEWTTYILLTRILYFVHIRICFSQ